MHSSNKARYSNNILFWNTGIGVCMFNNLETRHSRHAYLKIHINKSTMLKNLSESYYKVSARKLSLSGKGIAYWGIFICFYHANSFIKYLKNKLIKWNGSVHAVNAQLNSQSISIFQKRDSGRFSFANQEVLLSSYNQSRVLLQLWFN